MHILDLIIYLISIPILWKIIDVMSDGEFVEELGTLVGYFIVIIYTIIYVILFYWVDYNWIDIFHSIRDGVINWYSNLRL
jgi:hypothetical protein